MDTTWRAIIWSQFGAAIDMLDNAILACPDALWSDGSQQNDYWYVAYHALFWLDLYLSDSVEGFSPPAPFTLDELDPAGVLPEKPYTKQELKTYLEHGRAKCRATIAALTDEQARQQRWGVAAVQHAPRSGTRLTTVVDSRTANGFSPRLGEMGKD